ncbi:helix-turn-helix domain-containing protein [Streptomyces yunnanensis]|uniref:Helix-turn-helix domain-containing protein n=1 Tax=Streptomyces yunnanensis TaxID=156453 RepID=A0A9X8MT71_9ACTN|nr:helix-turn-helix transcriptional regulator [Streptomyces yunnanensis]SHL74443.1 Helix-turn-helix domain-containing protein [Streptomyces yunnanensis]
MDLDWKALATELRQARHEQMLTMNDLAVRSDVTRSTLHSLEQGTERSRIPSSLSKVEQGLGWPTGRAMEILTGKPTPATGGGSVSAEEIERSVSYAAIAVMDDMTSAQIKELARLAVEDLRRRGVI